MNFAHENYYNAMAEQARDQGRMLESERQLNAGKEFQQMLIGHQMSMDPNMARAAGGAWDPTAQARNLAEASEAGQRGAFYGAQARAVPMSTAGSFADTLSRANAINAGTSAYGDPNNILNVGGNAFNTGSADVHDYKHGKTKVPGHGPSDKDTVPSNLAPGEAVLNTEAADHLGRGTIQLLNAIGLAKRQLAGGGGVGAAQGQDPGMAAGNQEGSPVPGYAQGTDFTQRMNLMPGNPTGGTWGPSGDTPAGPNSGQALRASLGIQGAQRPGAPPLPQPQVKGPLGFNKGTTDVPATRKAAAREGAETKRAGKAPAFGGGGDGGGPGAKGGERQGMAKGKGQVEKHNGAEPNKAKPAKGGPPSHDKVHPDGHVTIHPDVLRSLLTMGGGGGMPTPGSTQPMPMPMPLAAGVGQTPPQQGGNATRLPMQGGGQ